MKVNLNLVERLTLMNNLPQEGNFATLKVIRDTLDVLGVNDEEHKYYEIKIDGKQTLFNAKKAQEEKEFELGEKANVLIQEALEKLNKEKKLTQQHFSIYEKFVKEE